MDPKIKLLRHFDRVQGILTGVFAPPVLADIDAVNGLCNVNCEWCAQRASRETKKVTMLPVETMKGLGVLSRKWGIRAWRMAGDSEPTLNPEIHQLFRSGHENGIDMGLITNGILLDTVQDLHRLRWIGISLDAASARTWSLLKHSPEKNFHRIINNIKRIRDTIPEVDVTIKYIRWSSERHLGRQELSPGPPAGEDAGIGRTLELSDNFDDAERIPELAASLGCSYVLRDALPKNGAERYRFEVCRATPLYGTFGADHTFYLCCDVRTGFVLTDDYTRNNWEELPALWGSRKHKDLIASVNPRQCLYCTKEWLNSIMENILLDGKYTHEYQVNFI